MGTPTIKIVDSWNVIQIENSLIGIKIFFLLPYLNIKPQSLINVIFIFTVEYKLKLNLYFENFFVIF